MTSPRTDTNSPATPGGAAAELATISAWLDSPARMSPGDELPALISHLNALRAAPAEAHQHKDLLDRLYDRVMLAEQALVPLLSEYALPIPAPRKTRVIIRHLQNVLRSVADDLLSSLANTSAQRDRARTLWQSMRAQAQHLSISHLSAAPAAKGLWQQLHRTYGIAVQYQLTDYALPANPQISLKRMYFSALLLGCAQPTSFSSREIDFVADYLRRFLDEIDFARPAQIDEAETFWIATERDVPATASARKPPPMDGDVQLFSCSAIVDTLQTHLSELDAGRKAASLGLPEFADSAAGRGVMRKLVTYWGDPGKRRFPRRRQNYRAVLCLGLDNIWRLFRDGGNALVDTSTWMIINESPDGYAVMHVSGKTGALSVGDVLAIRTESGDNWQTCVVRWALSENQEHLELGLQILSAQGMPAVLAQQTGPGQHLRLPVLVLPKVQALRGAELLVAATGALAAGDNPFVLVIERGNIVIREARSTTLEEQNSLIEVFTIEPITRSA